MEELAGCTFDCRCRSALDRVDGRHAVRNRRVNWNAVDSNAVGSCEVDSDAVGSVADVGQANDSIPG